MAEIRQDEYYMDLCVSTNPHLKSEHQQDLWNALKRKEAKPLKEMSEETRQKKAELEEYLRKRKDAV